MEAEMNFIRIKNFIGGQWVDETGGEFVSLYSPSTAEDITVAIAIDQTKHISKAREGKRNILLDDAKDILPVMEDAQQDLFIDNSINSCYDPAGQKCLAESIVAMVPEIYDSFLEKMMEAVESIKTGDALGPDVCMGPLISAKAKNKVEDHLKIGIKEGANLVLDGRNPEIPDKNKNGYFVQPTIFEDVTPWHTIAKKEIFGSLVSVMKVRDLDDALEIIRAQPCGNGACIFTQNQYYTETFIAEADMGMIGVNVDICAHILTCPSAVSKIHIWEPIKSRERKKRPRRRCGVVSLIKQEPINKTVCV